MILDACSINPDATHFFQTSKSSVKHKKNNKTIKRQHNFNAIVSTTIRKQQEDHLVNPAKQWKQQQQKQQSQMREML